MIVTLPSSDPAWIEPLVNFLAVLLGAALALGTSYFFERRSRRERDLAVAYSLIFILSDLCERIVRLDHHVKACLANAEATGFSGPKWGSIIEAIGLGAMPQPLSAEEFALVAKTKDSDLAMQIRELEAGHSICFQSYDRIIELKKVLAGTGLIVAADEQTVSFEATPEQYVSLAPIIAGLDTTAAGLLSILPDVVSHARQIAPVIGPKLKSHYKFDHFITVEIPE